MARKSLKTEQDMIREAVEEHGKRGRPKTNRRAGKVNTFNYKEGEAAKRKQADSFVAEQERVYGLREPRPPSKIEEFTAKLADDQKVFARMYFQMECGHELLPIAKTVSYVDGIKVHSILCQHCALVRTWQGSKTATDQAEWVSYCPDGFDMFDWQDLYTKDRGVWRFIHDEVLAEMVSESMTKEEE